MPFRNGIPIELVNGRSHIYAIVNRSRDSWPSTCIVGHRRRVPVKSCSITDGRTMVIICRETLVSVEGHALVLPSMPVALDDTTWFGSSAPLDRRHVLDSIESKTLGEYGQQRADQQNQCRRAKGSWPHVSEYNEQFTLRTPTDRKAKTA